jgi:hypothetical protein
MDRKAVIKISLIALGVIILLGVLLLAFTSVIITAPAIGIPLFITRNGQEVPPDQIKHVQYQIAEDVPKSQADYRISGLQEATHDQNGYYRLGAGFSIYRYVLFPHTEVKPDFRSISLYITFGDGKMITMKFPILSDTRENLPMYVDLSDAQH